ncbi:hypothetical protein ACJZ2D_008871 [Fusarium nematophilum]
MDDCLVNRDVDGDRPEQSEQTGQKTRACTNCARLKMKCQWPSSGAGRSENTCSRCSRMKITCQVPQTTQRKKRGKSTRVAQLEEKIDGIVSLLAANQRIQGKGGPSPLTPESPQDTQAQPQHAKELPTTVDLVVEPRPTSINILDSVIGDDLPQDFSDLELFPGFRISHDQAAKGLDLYRQEYSPQFPFVPLAAACTSHELYAQSRLLFWTIMAVVSPLGDKVQMEFKAWFRKYLAEHVVVRQEKYLDIVQAILIFLAWNDFHFYIDLQVTNILQLAMALVIDLKLDKQPGCPGPGPRTLLGDAWTSMGKPMAKTRSSHTPYERRAVLGVYYLTSLMSSLFRRGTPMHWSNHLAQCCDALFEAREYESDMYIIALVRMQNTADRAYTIVPAVGWQDPSPPILRAPVAMAIGSVHRELDTLCKFQPESVKRNSKYPPLLPLPPTISASDSHHPSEPFQRSDLLWKCLDSVIDFFNLHLAVPADEIPSLPVTVSCILAFATVTASRLILQENGPDWDSAMAQRRLGFPDVLKRLGDQFEDADKAAKELGRRRRVMEDGSSVFLKCSFKVRWIRQWYVSRIPQEQAQPPPPPQTMHPSAASFTEPIPDWAADFQFDDEFWADLMSGYDADGLNAAMATAPQAGRGGLPLCE